MRDRTKQGPDERLGRHSHGKATFYMTPDGVVYCEIEPGGYAPGDIIIYRDGSVSDLWDES